jgi:hypothetical protein
MIVLMQRRQAANLSSNQEPSDTSQANGQSMLLACIQVYSALVQKKKVYSADNVQKAPVSMLDIK